MALSPRMILYAIPLVLLGPAVTAFGATPLEQATQVQKQVHKLAQQSQQKIEKLDNQTQDLVQEYRGINRELENLRIYHQQLRKLIDSQERERISLARQLEDIEVTQRNITPLMLRMLEVLEQFVALDIPFLEQERGLRVTELRELMDRADVDLAEKYRRLMEAYQIETKYGRTLEAYQGDLFLQGKTRAVEFLRFGRLGLYYLTLDGAKAGFWNKNHSTWKPLAREYRSAIAQGLRVARKLAAPDLLKLLVPAPQQAQIGEARL